MMDARSRRPPAFWAACLGMLLFGVTLTTLGSVLPELITRHGVDKTRAGSLFTLMSLGILFGSLVFGPLVDRYGYRSPLTAAALLVLVGLDGIAYAPGFLGLRGAVLLFGLGGGMLNGGTNAVVSDLSGGDRGADLSLLGAFFGLGSFGVPLLIGLLAEVASYPTILGVLSLGVLLVAGFFLRVAFPTPKHPQKFPLEKGTRLLGRKTLWILGAVLFLQSGMEITTGGWTTTFFQEELAVAPRNAVYLLSLFWFGLTAARLVLRGLLERTSSAAVLLSCLGLAFGASLLLILAEAIYVGAIGIFLLGAGLSATYPIVLGYIGDLYTELSGTAFSIALTLGMGGGMSVPYLAGVLGEHYGLRVSFLIVPISLLGAALLFALAWKRFTTHHPDLLSQQPSSSS